MISTFGKITDGCRFFADDETTLKMKKMCILDQVIERRLLFDLSARSKDTWENRSPWSKCFFLFFKISVDQIVKELFRIVFSELLYLPSWRKFGFVRPLFAPV